MRLMQKFNPCSGSFKGLSPQSCRLHIDQILPDHGGNNGSVSARILGTGFQSGAQVKLTGLETDIIGTNTVVSSSGTLVTTSFDLKGAVPGVRNVVVTNPDSNSATLLNGFTIEQGGAPDVRISKAGTAAVPGRVLDYFIVVENVGNVNAENSLITEFLEPWFTFVSANPAPSDIAKATDLFPTDKLGTDYDAYLEWILPSLAPGEMRVFSYKATLDSSFPIGEIVRGPVCWANLGPDTTRCRNGPFKCILTSPGNCTGYVLDPPAFGLCLLRQVLYCEAAWAVCIGKSLYKSCDSNEQPARASVDPNEKVVTAKKFIQPNQLLVYPIHFENVGNAEARDIFVRDVIDQNLDASTLKLLTPEGGAFESSTRTINWNLLGINLPPEETGNVLLSVKPLPGLPSGTEIRNKATIQFEVFPPITTDEVVNVIDSTRLTALMFPLPAETAL
jgi:uncharacterized repeat protein (TIGR01451 family)